MWDPICTSVPVAEMGSHDNQVGGKVDPPTLVYTLCLRLGPPTYHKQRM